MSDSVQPHRWQPTRLLCPWDSPGKNTGVNCHFLLQCMHTCQAASVMSDSVWPHGQQPTRLLRPQDSPGKNTEVSCHFGFKERGNQKLVSKNSQSTLIYSSPRWPQLPPVKWSHVLFHKTLTNLQNATVLGVESRLMVWLKPGGQSKLETLAQWASDCLERSYFCQGRKATNWNSLYTTSWTLIYSNSPSNPMRWVKSPTLYRWGKWNLVNDLPKLERQKCRLQTQECLSLQSLCLFHCSMVLKKQDYTLFTVQKSSEQKNKDDSDIQRALWSYLQWGIGGSRELAAWQISGRKNKADSVS